MNSNQDTPADPIKSYEMFEHTADIGIRAYGRSLAEIFENASMGMYAIIFHESIPKIEPVGEYKIKLQASDLEQLILDWLDELLYIFSTEKIVVAKYQIEIDQETCSLDATVAGSIVPDEKLSDSLEIKAVTYHMLKVEKTTNWEAQVPFDI